MNYTDNVSDAQALLADITALKQLIRAQVGLIEARNGIVANESYLESVIEYVDETFHESVAGAKELLKRTGNKAPMYDREIEMNRGIV